MLEQNYSLLVVMSLFSVRNISSAFCVDVSPIYPSNVDKSGVVYDDVSLSVTLQMVLDK